MNTGIFPSQEPATQWRPRRQVFTSSGNWNRPSNVRDVEVEMCGAGGNSYTPPCGPTYLGGVGGSITALVRNVPPRVAITVGSAPGGTSSFGSMVTCTGGSNATLSGNGASGSATIAGNVVSSGSSTYAADNSSYYGGNNAFGLGAPGVVVVEWMEPVL